MKTNKSVVYFLKNDIHKPSYEKGYSEALDWIMKDLSKIVKKDAWGHEIIECDWNGLKQRIVDKRKGIK